jgi:hypothetical protein
MLLHAKNADHKEAPWGAAVRLVTMLVLLAANHGDITV